jgi:hypothetical protein
VSAGVICLVLVGVAVAALGGFLLGRRSGVTPTGAPAPDEARIHVQADAERKQAEAAIEKPPLEGMSHAQKLDELNRRASPK